MFGNWVRVHIINWLIPPKTIEVIDIIQILLIAYFVYHFILWVKNTRAYTLLKGILLIIAFIVIAIVFNMHVIVWLINNLSVAAITAVVIIFQPELRKVLEQVGHKNPISSLWNLGRSDDEMKLFTDSEISEIVRACFEMSEAKTGALIVMEREVKLEEFEETGIRVDALVSGSLLINIFEHNTPLHDGAVIIRGDRIMAATCYLPLSDNMDLSKNLGTRHRAGVGISEVSDSFTIIVSEETGKVSYAMEGGLHPVASPSELREKLHQIQHKGTAAAARFTRKERRKREKKSAQ